MCYDKGGGQCPTPLLKTMTCLIAYALMIGLMMP